MKSEFFVHLPTPPLHQWVQFIWISKGAHDTTRSKVLPNGAIELILNFGDRQKTLDKVTLGTKSFYHRFWIAGLQHEPIVIQSECDTNLLGIRFLPGGAFPFFKFPISEISDHVVEADWMKNELSELCDRIHDLINQKEIISLVEKFLWEKFDESNLVNPSVRFVTNHLLYDEDALSIRELIGKTGYSHKHFISMFKKQTGTTPKNLQRILRLQKIIQFVKNKPDVKWSDVLYRFSYYDPAHFVYDFKQLTGYTPDQYLAFRTFDENHCLIR